LPEHGGLHRLDWAIDPAGGRVREEIMSNQKLDDFIKSYNSTQEHWKEIFFDGNESAKLKITVKGPKVNLMAISHEPVLFFQMLSLQGYKRDDRGNMKTRLLPLKESPMSVPDISREMSEMGWDCDGSCYIPFYFHKQSGKGLPKRTSMEGYKWATEISDAPGTSFMQGPVDLYPEWDFAVLHFRTFIVRVGGISDVRRLPEMGKEDLTGMTFQPAHMVEWFAVPPWGVEGLKLWNRIFEKLNTAYMGGIVYPVHDFNPNKPLEGSNRLFPVHLTTESRKAMFFEPLRFWRERFNR
jgi:hypothetical protein